MKKIISSAIVFAVLLSLCLVLSLAPPSVEIVSASPDTFGYTTVGTLGSQNVAHRITGSVFTCANSGTADNIVAYFSLEQDGHVKAAIYSSDGSLITNGTTEERLWIDEKSASWETFTFSSPPSLTASTEYILVLWSNCDGPCSLYYDDGDGTTQGHYDSETYGSWPATASFTHEDMKYSIYCNYTAVAEAPTVTTNAATSVEETTATLNATVDSTGGENPSRMFDWDTGTGEPYANEENVGIGGVGTYYKDLTTLSPGTKYYFRARAVNSGGTGTGSELSFVTKPNPPTSLTATAISSSQIDLSWTKGTGAENTMIRRKTGSYPSSPSDGSQAYFGPDSTHSDTGLDPNTTYYYTAWSYTSGAPNSGYSDDNSQDSATTQVALPTVTTSSATDVEEGNALGHGNITDIGGESCDKRGFCWNTTGNPDVNDDNVEETGSFDTGAFSLEISGLSVGTLYYYKAYAHNSAGYGYGSEQTFSTKPQAPTSLDASNPTSTTIDLSWTRGTGAENTIIKRATGGYPPTYNDGDEVYTGTGTITQDTGLDPATMYYYRAWAWSQEDSKYSDSSSQDTEMTNEMTLVYPSQPVLYLPEDLSVTADTTPYLEWTNGGNAENHNFVIDDDLNFGSINDNHYFTGSDNSHTIPTENALSDGTYYWKVIAINENGENASDVWTFTVGTPVARWRTVETWAGTVKIPTLPGQIVLHLPPDGTKTNDSTPYFEWGKWGDGADNDNYRLLVDASPPDWLGCAENRIIVGDNNYTIADENSLSDGNYSWKIIAISAGGENESEVWTFLIDTVSPAAPTLTWPGDDETIGDSTPNLDWNDVEEDSLPVTYDVQVDDDPSFTSLEEGAIGITTDSYQIKTELAEGTWYWRVRAKDNAGNIGSWSSRVMHIVPEIITRGVEASISPGSQNRHPGDKITFIIIVTNTGNVDDTYTLENNDNSGWSLSISPTSLAIPAGENRTATLSVTIPENAAIYTIDNIRVKVISQGDDTVSAESSCTAHAVAREVSRWPSVLAILAATIAATITSALAVRHLRKRKRKERRRRKAKRLKRLKGIIESEE
jgi:hypothetical protein